MLAPIQDKTEGDSQDIWYLFESFNSEGRAVITIVASIKPWCHEWRAYWMAFSIDDARDDAYRFERCRTIGNKIDVDVARAMFPEVEQRFGVHWGY